MGFQTVVLKLHGGVGQFYVAVLQFQHQCLLLQLLVLQLVGRYVEAHLLVAQFQLLGFEFHKPQIHGCSHLYQQVIVAHAVRGVAHLHVSHVIDVCHLVIVFAFKDEVAHLEPEERRR